MIEAHHGHDLPDRTWCLPELLGRCGPGQPALSRCSAVGPAHGSALVRPAARACRNSSSMQVTSRSILIFQQVVVKRGFPAWAGIDPLGGHTGPALYLPHLLDVGLTARLYRIDASSPSGLSSGLAGGLCIRSCGRTFRHSRSCSIGMVFLYFNASSLHISM